MLFSYVSLLFSVVLRLLGVAETSYTGTEKNNRNKTKTKQKNITKTKQKQNKNKERPNGILASYVS